MDQPGLWQTDRVTVGAIDFGDKFLSVGKTYQILSELQHLQLHYFIRTHRAYITTKICHLTKWLQNLLLDNSGSRDIIGHVTIGFPVGHFLWPSFGPLEQSLYL